MSFFLFSGLTNTLMLLSREDHIWPLGTRKMYNRKCRPTLKTSGMLGLAVYALVICSLVWWYSAVIVIHRSKPITSNNTATLKGKIDAHLNDMIEHRRTSGRSSYGSSNGNTATHIDSKFSKSKGVSVVSDAQPTSSYMDHRPKPNGFCNGCYKWRFPPVIVPPRNLCTHQTELDLIILATSIHKNREHRNVIRDTWGNFAQTNRTRVVFTFGMDPTGNQTEEARLRQEANSYGDILQFNLNGTYRNLSQIVINSYDWVLANCSEAKFVGKVSDDAFINIPELLRLLDTRGKDQLHDVLFGLCSTKGAVPFRSPRHRWYVSYKEYPFELFPSYCSGAGVFMSRDILGDVTEAVSHVAFPMRHDDVLLGAALRITGHCPCNIEGFFPRGSKMMMMKLRGKRPEPITCEYMGTVGYFIGLHFHSIKPEVMAKFWRHRSCLKGKQKDFSTLKCPRKGTCVEDFYHIDKPK